jgi:hypothetical protein
VAAPQAAAALKVCKRALAVAHCAHPALLKLPRPLSLSLHSMATFDSLEIFQTVHRIFEHCHSLSFPPVDTFQAPVHVADLLKIHHEQFTIQRSCALKEIENLRCELHSLLSPVSCVSHASKPSIYSMPAAPPAARCAASLNITTANDAIFSQKLNRSLSAAEKRKADTCMRQVFDRHADTKGQLSCSSLMAALQDVEAPVLAIEGLTAGDIFRRSVSNMNEAVDFAEYHPAFQFILPLLPMTLF